MKLTELKQTLNTKGITFQENEPLAPFTTWKIGGAADILIRLKESKNLPEILKTAHELEVPVTYLGGGSNVLISDEGIRGIVIKNELSAIEIANNVEPIDADRALSEKELSEPTLLPRLNQVDTNNYYDFASLDYSEADSERVAVSIHSGVNLSYAINFLIQKGVTGLQWFAGIPGTIGGAIYNNIHGGSHYMSEFIESIEVISDQGETKILSNEELMFDYDYSILQQTSFFIVKGNFLLYRGDKERATRTAIAWAQAKSKKQPYNSAGCCYKNLSEEKRSELRLESGSWGYIVDQVLNLKGKQIGGAMISDKHAAFIENKGGAKAEDVIALLELVHQEASQKLQGTTPKTEIFFLGFPKERVAKFL